MADCSKPISRQAEKHASEDVKIRVGGTNENNESMSMHVRVLAWLVLVLCDADITMRERPVCTLD